MPQKPEKSKATITIEVDEAADNMIAITIDLDPVITDGKTHTAANLAILAAKAVDSIIRNSGSDLKAKVTYE